MAGQELNAVLRRKAQEGRQEHRARVMTPVKALRMAMARAADDAFGLDLSVREAEVEKTAKPEVTEALEEGDLLLVLDGQSGHAGAVAFDQTIVAALVEQQTIGTVTSREAGDRQATRVDAAMAAPLVDRALAGFETALAVMEEAAWAEGYRFGAMVEDVRGLDLVLDAHEYHLFRLQLELGGGAKSGRMILILPDRAGTISQENEAEDATRGEPGRGGGAVLDAPAEMIAVLARISLPFDELRALRPGQVLTLAGDALHQTVLEAGQGQKVADVTLGQLNGFRAVRLGGSPGLAIPDAMEALPEPPVSATVLEREAVQVVDDLSSLPMVPEPVGVATGEETVPEAEAAGLPMAPVSSELDSLPDLSDLPDLADLPGLSDGLASDVDVPLE